MSPSWEAFSEGYPWIGVRRWERDTFFGGLSLRRGNVLVGCIPGNEESVGEGYFPRQDEKPASMGVSRIRGKGLLRDTCYTGAEKSEICSMPLGTELSSGGWVLHRNHKI